MTKIFVNDPNKCHHSQPLPGNNIYIYIYPLMGTGSCSTSILNTSLEMPTATGHDVVMSCLPSVLWLMNVGTDIIKYYNMIYIYIYYHHYYYVLLLILLFTIIIIIVVIIYMYWGLSYPFWKPVNGMTEGLKHYSNVVSNHLHLCRLPRCISRVFMYQAIHNIVLGINSCI